MDKNYKQFINKLNAYIRKYYLYQLVRGIILVVLLSIVYFSIISLLEYFSYFDPEIKFFIFLCTLLLLIFIVGYFLVLPVIKLLGLGKRINYLDVSDSLKKSYPEIKDRLINIVELENDLSPVYSDELKKASIDQKIDELKIYRFSDAIQFKNLRIVFFALIGVAAFFTVSFISSPEIFSESSVRLVHFQQKYIKPAPFSFHLENKVLELVTGESVELRVRCEGKDIPSTLFVNIGGNNFLMVRDGSLFSYSIENINRSFSFYFTDKQYVSENFRLSVLNKPFVSSFTVEIKPPAYTTMSSEIFNNSGDLKIMAGTVVHWKFNTVDTDSLFFVLADSTKIYATKRGDQFELSKSFLNDSEYRVVLKNSRLKDAGSLVYRIQIVADLFPEIKVVQIRDTLDFRRFHFKGNIVDDFGFSNLFFNVKANEADTIFKVHFVPYLLNQDFYYSFNFESLKSLGNSFSYYFSVFDNDQVQGQKKSISETFLFKFPDYQEIELKEKDDLNKLDKLFEKSSKLTEDIQREFLNFRKKQIDSQVSDFEKFQMVKDVMRKKTELEHVLDQIKKQNSDVNNFLNSFSEVKSEILEKQKQIEELLNEVFSDDLKNMFEEFNELAKKFDSKKLDELTKNMDVGMDDLAKQLEKNVQLLKKMKVEQKIERIVSQLQTLSSEEKDLLNGIESRKDLKEISKEMLEKSSLLNQLFQDYKETMELNSGLDKPMNLFDFNKEFSELNENHDKIVKESDSGNKRKTSSEIQNSIKNLDQLSFAMNQMLKAAQKRENHENIENLKQILNNLLTVSFDQEKLLKSLSLLDYNNPMVNQIKVRQKYLQSQAAFAKDSLYALSKRSPEIGAVISKEMLSLESNISTTLNHLENGNIGGARMTQQFGITAANNLTLFLAEALDNLKKQKQSGEGDGDCDEPGGEGSKPGMKKLKESQQSIKEQLQQMIDQMKKGDVGNLSRNIGQTIAHQEMMQQLIQEMMGNKSVGQGAKEQLKMIDQLLEQSRRDLINRNITGDLISRQNLILSKLLEAERSEIERGEDEKRESKTANEILNVNQSGYFEYTTKQRGEGEFFKQGSLKLKSFYDKKYNSFLNRIKE